MIWGLRILHAEKENTMNHAYHYTYKHRELILSDERSSIGYGYPRIFYVEPLAKHGYINYDVALDTHFNMKPSDWVSWLDDELIEVNDEQEFIDACESSSLNGKVVLQWLTNNVTPQYTEKEFFDGCIGHGGNLTALLLSGVKGLYPNVWEQLPDVQYTFSEASFIVDVLVTDKDPTYCGVKVNKHLDTVKHRVLSYNANGFHFEDVEIDSDRPMRDMLDDWYIANTDVTHEDIDEFEAVQWRNRLADNARAAMNRAVWGFNAQAPTGLHFDPDKVWLKAWYDDTFNGAVFSCASVEDAEKVAERYFEDVILEMPLSQAYEIC